MPTPPVTVQSFFALFLLAIEERMQLKVPSIKWVDQDLGQLEEDTDRPSVAFPCVLIDFGSTNYSELHEGEQWADNTLQMRIGFNPYSSAAVATPLEQRQKALAYYEIEQQVYQAFQYWDGNGLCQPMTRTYGGTEKNRADMLRVRTMLFTTTFMDDSAAPATLKVTRPLISLNTTTLINDGIGWFDMGTTFRVS